MNAKKFFHEHYDKFFMPITPNGICRFAEAFAASGDADKKLLRDAINQQLAQLRDWANDAERRCKAETAAKEAETERADRLAEELAFNRQSMSEAYKVPELEHLLKAAEERADRAERAQGWISPRTSLPDEDVLVLVAVACESDDHDGVTQNWQEVHEATMYRGGCQLIAATAEGTEYEDDEILGWMMMPDPPLSPLSPIPSPAKPEEKP